MKSTELKILLAVLLIAGMSSCQEGYIGHVGTARLVIVQPLPVTEGKLDDSFRPALEMLFPFECHDTVFIQDRIFLERTGTERLFRKEFTVAPNLLRDFFGSRNPAKIRALREILFYEGDSCISVRPEKALTDGTTVQPDQFTQVIEAYLSANRKNALVYLVSPDTNVIRIRIENREMPVHHDFSRLNCRIVSDLRERSPEDLAGLTVLVILLPVEQDFYPGTREAVRHDQQDARHPARDRGDTPCPPDTAITRINRERGAVITEFRNLLHYIATTTGDSDLKERYRADARAELQKIPGARVEGIPGNDLGRFLNSGFGRNVVVTLLFDRCGRICGVRVNCS